MKLLLLLIAEKIIVDQRSGDVSAINLIEAVGSVSFPYLIAKPVIMVAFHKDDGDQEEAEGTLKFLMGDEEIARATFVIDFGGHPRTRSIIELNGIAIPKPGHLKVCVDVQAKQQGDWDILASQIGEEQLQATQLEPSAGSSHDLPPPSVE